MAVLGLLAFGGNFHAGSGLAAPVTEIWECTLAVSAADDGFFDQSNCDALAAIVQTWFESADAKISDNVDLSYVKWNEYSLLTGHQVTDPTLQTLVGGSRGASGGTLPYTASYRISLDNGTRNRRAHGGFYVPRPALSVQDDGRISPGNLASLLFGASTFLHAVNTHMGSSDGVSVWSRREKALHPSTRVRVGDVPDNIRRRKNAMRETYAVDAL